MGLIIDCFKLKDKYCLPQRDIFSFNKSFILYNFNQVSGSEHLKINVVGNTQIRAVQKEVP
jgi:hypothetical protein